MRINLITILLLFSFKLTAQTSHYQQASFERDSLGKLKKQASFITAETSDVYLNIAVHLVSTQQSDSLTTAYFILKRLNHFDSLKYANAKFKNYYKQIETGLLNYYNRMIIGEWSFRWGGSNWGTSETSANKKASIIFTDSVCSFYVSDTLQRQTKYLITNKFSNPFSQVVTFQLYFVDSKEVWDFSFRTKGADYFARLKLDEQHIGLYINEMPGCSCGCPESLYLKNESTSSITLKQ